MNQFVMNLFTNAYYKRNQGRTVRRATGFASFLLFAVCAYRMDVYFGETYGVLSGYIVASIVALFGLWFSYRLVNYPRFADFLVSVEAEMSKVSWPSRDELYRSSVVVLVVMFFLAALLFAYDFAWNRVLTLLNYILSYLAG